MWKEKTEGRVRGIDRVVRQRGKKGGADGGGMTMGKDGRRDGT